MSGNGGLMAGRLGIVSNGREGLGPRRCRNRDDVTIGSSGISQD